MDKIAEYRDRIVDICCPDGAEEFVREAVASILLKLVEEKFTFYQQLKAEIAALVPIVSSIKVSWHDTNKHFLVTERLRQLSAV